MRLKNKQIEELGRYLLDISKLVFGSLVLGLFSAEEFGPGVVLAVGAMGLIFAGMFCILGIKLLGRIKK